MKTKYVVVLTVELDQRLTKKAVREWVAECLDDPSAGIAALITKTSVRSVDKD